jgi:hypothetical protein
MDSRSQLQSVINSFSPQHLVQFFRTSSGSFRPADEDFTHYLEDETLADLRKLGEIEFEDAQRLILIASRSEKELTTRSGKKRQYELAKKILKGESYDAGIFVFYDSRSNFRFSLVAANYFGKQRLFSSFRRYTYFVSPELPNKTFLNQVGRVDFSSLDGILEAFSIEAVSHEFYAEFKPKFDRAAASVQGSDDENLKQNFALLFVMRVIFLGFVQKKGWLGGNPEFMQAFWAEYKNRFDGQNRFYADWLTPLFFEALNSAPGRKVAYGSNDFSASTEAALQMAPYLNGDLFKGKRGVDDQSLCIPDEFIGDFFDFLFQYNFTIEENTLYDEELELNPEFLGIIFERLVSKADGAIYTPRTEVDFMCRMALVKWLQKNSSAEMQDLYRLFFREAGSGHLFDEAQKQGDFSTEQIRELVQRLENVTVCDPAAGSGAFEVGILHVLEEVLENLYTRNNAPSDLAVKTPFERKQAIIANSLYGVEVKRWAVWINQLRLWLTLFIDMPDDFKGSFEPLLPNLNFKVRVGDSLVQRIGSKTFPVFGHAALPAPVKRRITNLKKMKGDFFYNRGGSYEAIRQEETLVFGEMLDTEIGEKRSQLHQLLAPQLKQGILEIGAPLPEQGELYLAAATAQQRAWLETEIAELQDQKHSLTDERTFIWSIEFAEVFFERGGFDIIIGNPPYVRQEDISDPNEKLDPKAYKAALQEMVRLDFPDHFTSPRKPAEFRKGLKPDGKSDLYTYFYIRSLRLLNPAGMHVFICSNSWLDVGYGKWLQEFMLNKTPMHFVFDNHARRSFASADINTIITIFDAPLPKRKTVNLEQVVKFAAFKQPFEQVVLTENLLEIEAARKVEKNERLRVYPISVGKLLEEGSEFESAEQKKLGAGKYVGDKWGGKYLRAPDIFFTILEKGKDYINILGNFLEGERYLNTGGADKFFIITKYIQEDNHYWIVNTDFSGRINKKYLKPLVKNVTKTNKNILVTETDALCFVVEDDFSKLPSSVINYIQWGESKGYHMKSVTHLQKPWYKPTRQMLHGAEILLPRSFNDTFLIHNNPFKSLSLRFYRLHPKSGHTKQLIAYLNSTPFWLIFETLGNKNLGQGVLDFFMAPFLKMKIPIILDARQEKLLSILYERSIGTIFTECGIDPTSDIPIFNQEPHPLPDRKELDDVVFDALDLSESERKDVYRAVCQLVWDRISKAKSVKKRK